MSKLEISPRKVHLLLLNFFIAAHPFSNNTRTLSLSLSLLPPFFLSPCFSQKKILNFVGTLPVYTVTKSIGSYLFRKTFLIELLTQKTPMFDVSQMEQRFEFARIWCKTFKGCYAKTPLDGRLRLCLLREVPLVHLSNKTIKQWVHLWS